MLKIDVFKKKKKKKIVRYNLFSRVRRKYTFKPYVWRKAKSDLKKLIENIEEIEFEDLYCMFACKISLLQIFHLCVVSEQLIFRRKS